MGEHECRLAGRPGDRAVRTERDMIDPASLGVGRQHPARADVGRHHLAVVAAADNAFAVAGGGENGAAMHRHPAQFAARLGEQQRFLAEREHGGAAEEMGGDNGAAGVDRTRALDDGDGITAGVGHELRLALLIPSPQGEGKTTPYSSRNLRRSSCPAGCGR